MKKIKNIIQLSDGKKLCYAEYGNPISVCPPILPILLQLEKVSSGGQVFILDK